MSIEPTSAIAQSLIAQFSGQTDLLLKLALAVCGGIVAAVVKIVGDIKQTPQQTATFRWISLLLWCFFLECGSILSGYCVLGALSGSTPELFLKVDYAQAVNPADIEYLSGVRFFALSQFTFLLAGIFFVLVFLFLNRGVVRKKGITMTGDPLTTLLLVANVRHKVDLHGYEHEGRFLEELKEMQEEFRSAVESEKATPLDLKALGHLCVQALNAYHENRETFERFFQNSLSKEASMKGKKVNEVAGEILAFYIAAHERLGPAFAANLRTGSHVFPFCKSKQ